MSNRNLTVKLEARTDENGHKYYISKLKIPGQLVLNLEDGVTFLVYTSEEGAEEMQIAPMAEKKPMKDYKQRDYNNDERN